MLELNDGEYAYLDGNLYAVGGKLYRMATISDEDGNSSNQLVELLIADDGALSLGEIIDLGDALCVVETYGDESYTYTPQPEQPPAPLAACSTRSPTARSWSCWRSTSRMKAWRR